MGSAIAWRWNAVARWLAGDVCSRLIQCIARIPVLRSMPRLVVVPLETRLIAASGDGLFDPDFYRLQNPDVARAGTDPFRHYLRHGWREGRAPNAQFDDGYYRAESGLSVRTPVSPLAHFIAFGHKSGLCPVPGIDLSAVAGTHPQLGVARLNPYQQLVTRGVPKNAAKLPDAAALKAELMGLSPRSGTPDIDVIVPVYLGRCETLNTLLHVLKAPTQVLLNLVVVDDATPDTALRDDLSELHRRGMIRLIRHEQNQGFVAAINRGMRDTRRDVIWLNADTEVYDGWADRLRAAALSNPNVATVTPLTNNGTICSYPRTNTDNPGTLEIPWATVDALAADVNAGVRVQAPTAVGFCTYVRRDALDAIGTLDAAAFGQGYGEENDFSQRAASKGWQNLIAADVFVRHFGSTSFRGSRAQRVETALRILDARYPDYRDQVQTFLDQDALAPARTALDLARLNRFAGTHNVLMITHSLGGGTQQHVQEETQRLTGRGASVFVLRGGVGGPSTASLSPAGGAPLPSLSNLDLDDDRLWSIIQDLGIHEVHVHHLIDFAPAAPQILRRRLAQLGLPHDVMVHDYYPICPRVNLVDSSGFYCGEPGLSGCQSCLKRRGSGVGRVEITQWRFGYEQFLRAAREVRVPDVDVARRLRKYFPSLDRMAVRPHEPPPVPAAHPGPGRSDGQIRVALLGALGPTKGFDALLGLARYAVWQDLPLALTVIGHTRNDMAARAAGITVTGAYVNAEVDDLITRVDPDLIWISSVWPETYSYTLSIALRSGRPVAAFDIGAMGTRLRAAGRGTLIPLDIARDPEGLYRALGAAAGIDLGLQETA